MWLSLNFYYHPQRRNDITVDIVSCVDRELKAVQMLQTLYIGRCSACWKLPSVLEWLETNVKEVLARVEDKDPCVEEYSEM